MERTTRVLKDEIYRILRLIKDGLRSQAYLYPFKGIAYFLTHPSLNEPFFSRLGPQISLGLAVTGAMFFFTYIPQTALLALTSGPLLAPFSGALLVLSESSSILNFLAKSGFVGFLDDSLLDTFDGTLVARGDVELVATNRQVKRGTGGVADSITRLGGVIKPKGSRMAEKMSLSNLIRSVLYLPLNFIPVVGTLMYVCVQGKRVGPLFHSRYFRLKGWSVRERDEWIAKNRAAYTSFGIAAFLLEMIPFASLAFTHTNAVGGALWASDLEKSFANTSGERKES